MTQGIAGAMGTVLAMSAFIAVVVWSWSKRRKPDFDAAARLPLEDDSHIDLGSGGRQ